MWHRFDATLNSIDAAPPIESSSESGWTGKTLSRFTRTRSRPRKCLPQAFTGPTCLELQLFFCPLIRPANKIPRRLLEC